MLDPSVRRSSAGSSMPSPAGCQPDRGGGQGVVGDQVDDGVDVLGGQVRGAHLTVRLGAHVPDLPGRAAGLDLVADPRGGVPHPRRIHRVGGCCAAGGQGRGHHERHASQGRRGPPRPAPARRLVARSGCVVRAWRRGSPGWPAGRAGSPPPPSAGGRGRPGTRSPARRGGPRSTPAGTTSAGSGPGRHRPLRGPGACPARCPARSAKTSPRRVRRCFSRAVL